MIIELIPQVVERTGKGLFFSSEQVVEASHQLFGKFWERYKVLDMESEVYGERFLSCVLDFNTANL